MPYTVSTSASNPASCRSRGRGSGTGSSARMRPGLEDRTRIRSASWTASSMLCVTISTALTGKSWPSHSRVSSPRRLAAVSTSSAENGSSISSASGSTASARANPTRWRMPPDSSFGYADSNPSSPIRSIARSALARRSASGTSRASMASSTFCCTVSQGSRANDWKTMATPGLAPFSNWPR